jgi:uncharacterized protein
MTARIADAGFIIALKSPKAKESAWARDALEQFGTPFHTCEGALIEASHFVSPALMARLLIDRTFKVSFDLETQAGAVEALLRKYSDYEMDMVDACIVRMSELYPDCEVFSIDHDFDVYRRFRNQPIPTNYPPER